MASRNSARHQQYIPPFEAPIPLCKQKKHSRTLRHAMSCALGRGIGNGGVDTRKAGRCFFTTPPSHCATVMPLVRDHFMELMNRGMRTSREERAKAIANQKIAPTKKYIHQAIPIATPKATLARKSRANNKA